MKNDRTILTTTGLTKYFYDPEKFMVLKGIDLSVSRGEFVSLVGKSGCGKSTLMYVLSTMDTDYEGQLTIAGQNLTGRHQNELAAFRNAHIGFVFQFHFLLPEFTVLQNVMLPAMKLGKLPHKDIESKAIEKLASLGMDKYAQKKTNKLSGGQQQRAAIARAMINDPDIIMCDEPTGNLDSQNSHVVFDIFKKLAAEHGQTIITVTHDQEFAARSDRRIEMSDGKIIG